MGSRADAACAGSTTTRGSHPKMHGQGLALLQQTHGTAELVLQLLDL